MAQCSSTSRHFPLASFFLAKCRLLAMSYCHLRWPGVTLTKIKHPLWLPWPQPTTIHPTSIVGDRFVEALLDFPFHLFGHGVICWGVCQCPGNVDGSKTALTLTLEGISSRSATVWRAVWSQRMDIHLQSWTSGPDFYHHPAQNLHIIVPGMCPNLRPLSLWGEINAKGRMHSGNEQIEHTTFREWDIP